ncbi:MAG: hypothetical protein Q7S48_02180, partial [bacterium]|nr:hypothetical protein [bacterium]
MKKYLIALGFIVKGTAKKWSVAFPYWREVEADGLSDIAEEVARMYGYHLIEGKLPEGILPNELPNQQFTHEHDLKNALCGAGYTELYTYSFVSRQDVSRAGLDPDHDALALRNPLSVEMTDMRPWLGISMLKAVAQNEKEREVLRLFELSAEYHPRGGELPDERQKLIVASAGKQGKNGKEFYDIKGIAEYLARILSIPSFRFEKINAPSKAPWVGRYHPSRVLLCKSGPATTGASGASSDILGVVGEVHPSLLRAYGIENRVAFLEWEMKAILPLIGMGRIYQAPSPYPKVLRDIAFLVSKDVEYAVIEKAMRSVDPLIVTVELFDQYEGKGVPEGLLSLAFHISYASSERTLKGEEADKAHLKLSHMLKERFDAKVRD